MKESMPETNLPSTSTNANMPDQEPVAQSAPVSAPAPSRGGFVSKMLFTLLLLLVAAAAYFVGYSQGVGSFSVQMPGEIVPGVANPFQNNEGSCPRDAFICPDGTTVGRSGPQCEFDACPGDAVGNNSGDLPGDQPR